MPPSAPPEAAGGSAEGSASTSDAASTLAQFFQTMQEADASTLLSSLLGEDDPRFAQLGQLLDDESTCAEALGALREISSMPYERWGPAAAVRSLPRPLSLAPALLKAASTAPNPHHALLVDCRCIAAQSPADA